MEANTIENFRNNFEKDGYLFIPGFFSAARIKEINEHLQQFITRVVPSMPANHVFYEDMEQPDTLKQLQDLQVHSAYFNELMTNSELQKIATILLGEEVIGKNVEYFNKPALIGKATPPHQDAFYFNIKPTNAITMWLALEQADPENGCVSYIRGSHKNGMRTHALSSTKGFSQSISDFGTPGDMANLQIFPAKAGDLLIHHCMTIHTAGKNITIDRSRKALGLIYFGESAQPDLEAREAYNKSLHSQVT
jgi:phytanoyl-CoA hydroxylase